MQRHQIIENLLASQTEKNGAAALVLWKQMSSKIIAIIGAGGFSSLYARSMFLTQASFPWLVACAPTAPATECFVALQNNLDSQSPGNALAANHHLLCTFTDILAALIGEELTSSILRSAWGDPASAQISKGSENE